MISRNFHEKFGKIKIIFTKKLHYFFHFLAQFVSSNFLAELEQRQQQLYSVEKGSVRER